MKRPGAAIISILATLCALSTARATYLPQERIPTDSPLYRDLERVAIRNGIAPRFLSSRPLRRGEALAFLNETARANVYAGSDPAIQRALRTLDPSAKGATRPLISGSGDYGERLEISPYGSFLYADDPRNSPTINRDYRLGISVYGSLDTASVFVADIYQGTASQSGRGTPDFGDFNSLIQGVNFNSYVRDTYVEFPISKIRLLFGHTWLRWGPGEAGTLGLSDAAPALDMLRAEAGMLRVLRYTQFVALLDPGPETYLAGHRLEWQATGRLSLGLSELARFDGTSQVPLYFIPFVPYSYWEKRPKSGGVSPDDSTGELLRKNNVLWSVDASWFVRPGWRIYGEFLLDDISFSSDYKPDMIGYQAGIDWRRSCGGGSAVGAKLEYGRVHNYVYSAWHGHDFSFQGFPTGYVLGPDVQAVGCEVTYEWGANLEFRAEGEWRRKGEGHVGDPWRPSDGKVDASAFAGVVEQETRAMGTIVYSPMRAFRIQAAVGVTSVTDRGNVESGTIHDTPFLLETSVGW